MPAKTVPGKSILTAPGYSIKIVAMMPYLNGWKMAGNIISAEHSIAWKAICTQAGDCMWEKMVHMIRKKRFG